MSRFKVAISHQADEAELARAWEELLRKVSGSAIECWFSTDKRPAGGMPIGKDWRDTIYKEFGVADDVLALQSPRSNGRPWVMWECGAASGLQKERGVVPIIYSMEERDLNAPLSSYETYRGDDRGDVHRICDLLMREAKLVLDEMTFNAHYPTYQNRLQQFEPAPLPRGIGQIGSDEARKLVEGWLQTVCRAISAPQTPEQLKVSVFTFRKQGELLVKEYLWCHRPRAEVTSPLKFKIDEQTASRVVVVKCFLENGLWPNPSPATEPSVEPPPATGANVEPLPNDFRGKEGAVSPDVGYVLAAPIRSRDEIWGVVDFDASSDEGAKRLKEGAAADVLSCLANNLSVLVTS